MQYLTKAYSYYSGINPATLSGAIDVIVVRHVDENGHETLSSSPFHVRFGKLQVLRAGEKRVTIKLPNNLPEPHVAPFSMKVGETGEAFFVLETEEEVPPDLLTSPVVMPAEETEMQHSHEPVPVEEDKKQTFATNEPFGDTEKPYKEMGKPDALDADVLDLNDSVELSKSKPVDPPQTPKEKVELPKRNKKLEDAHPDEVPEVDPATVGGPEVVYGKDVVLDMAGYHSHQDASRSSTPKPVEDARVEALARDLEEAARALTERPQPIHRSTDPVDDVSDADSEPDIGALSLEEGYDRHVRATSEPPATPTRIARPANGALFPPSSPTTSAMDLAWDWSAKRKTAKLKNVEENPSLFVLETERTTHLFELSLCGNVVYAPEGQAQPEEEGAFLQSRITFQRFIEDPNLVDDPNLVLRYNDTYVGWSTGYELLLALSMYRRALTPPASSGAEPTVAPRASGYGWSRWWRRQEASTEPPPPPPEVPKEPPAEDASQKHYAKTLRLSSDQLKQLNLHKGANTIQFSVTSSYSGFAVCSARIFLWESTDQVVISDIDGTITKSDALGHVFAAIGRDWTHLGIARLYTDIANNGYKMMYLTSRAIGQADTTREYLRSINQGEYRMPEGPVIMSPDRLMASLHREVIMRKPELFKMACLRDIQRLFGPEAKAAFYAGFGNRITDAMSYRSVGVEPSKIYTIDSTGVVKTELLQTAGHKGSYILLNDLVNEVFPPVARKVKPEYTDFNYWRNDIPDIPLPDLSPPSPALSARSDSSMSVLSKIIGRRSSRQILPSNTSQTSRPSSPLIGPAVTPDASDDEEEGFAPEGYTHSRRSSMPGSFNGDEYVEEGDIEAGVPADFDDDDEQFDDDILAAGEMRNVPF